MKQVIVLLATVILGIFLGSMVLGFKGDASALKAGVSGELNSLKNELKAY